MSRLSLLAFLFIAALSSCKEFIEPSIAKKTLTLQAPADNYTSQQYAVTFWWEELEDALAYRLQVVRPSFDSVAAIVLDTLIKGDNFQATLDPGSYQWRLRAENGSSQTSYTTVRTFTVLPGSLAEQTPTLVTPGNNATTSQNNINLQWASLYGAYKYQLQIDTAGFANENNMIVDQNTATQQFTFHPGKEQVYQWRIRGLSEDESEKSKWSGVFTFTYDHTPPATPILASPENNVQLPKPFTLSWGAVTGARQYKLYIYKNNATTLFSDNFPLTLTTTNYAFNQGNAGERIYWKVASIDAAGNESVASELRSITLQ